MNFEDFESINFPPMNVSTARFVYVLFIESEAGQVPFYVGQTGRIWGRMDDYYWAGFAASTDFRVGEAIRYLYAKGYRVTVKYKTAEHSLTEENSLIKELLKTYPLINSLPGYNYRTACEEEERKRIKDFVNEIVAKLDPRNEASKSVNLVE